MREQPTKHGRMTAVAVTCCALMLFAYGSSSPRGPRSSGGVGFNSSQTQIHNESLRFARCARQRRPELPRPARQRRLRCQVVRPAVERRDDFDQRRVG
jgi:hypothetical protein